MTKGFRAAVYLVDKNENPRRISPNDGLFYQASIHPDGTEVVFFGGKDGKPRIWRHLVGHRNEPAPITPPESGARHPVYSWNGNRIAFASDRDFATSGETIADIDSATRNTIEDLQLNLFSANPDGSDVRQVTHGPYVDHRPCFSPNGDWIAFASNRSGVTGIWRVPADGSSDPVPVFTEHWAYRPWYTATDDSILFYGPDGERHRIWEVGVATGAVTRLEADDRGMTHGPFVAPGRPRTVVVHTTRSGSWGIWELPLRGKSPVRNVTPPGFPMAAHATISRNETMAFDVKESWTSRNQ